MEHAQAFVEDLDKQEFIADLKTRAAAERAIEIIERPRRTYPTTYARRFAEAPWRQMAGMRDRVAHVYFGVDYDILWKTITEDSPPLIPEIQEIIRVMQQDEASY